MKTKFLFLLILIANFISAQEKKSVEALYLSTPLEIDAYLDEPVYNEIAPAKDFMQLQPYNGDPSYQPSEVYFFYDQNAVYVGAMLYDSSPDSIFNLFSERDAIGMSDYFGVYIDPYNEGQLAFGFFITPAGVQTDIKAMKVGGGDMEDGSWNAVWESKTRIAENGWIIEMRIPYSALRFPEKEANVWGMNMFRNIRRYNSNNSWNLIDRNVSGFIDQEGELTGINNIKPPVRLSVSPYFSTYLEFNSDGSPDFIYKGGMDLKYGLSESFTLDMMLIPDFGQVQSDNLQLNLSPYELFFSEKRQFFTEGTELFQKANIFYSRRIGASPKFSYRAYSSLQENEIVTFNPSETKLVNATKISGRTKNGLAIGILNAISLPAKATIENTVTGETREVTTQPLTNYNVTVFDQTLKNNSYISLINTNIMMANDPFMANSIATDFQFRNKSKTYVIEGNGGVSTRHEKKQETGFGGYLRLAKNSGSFRYGISQSIKSDDLNINDMGYMQRNNELYTNAYLYYQDIEPSKTFRNWNMNLNWSYIRLYKPGAFFGSEINYNTNGLFTNNYYFWTNVGIATKTNDYYEARVDGRYLLRPSGYWGNFGFQTDSRKKLTFYFEAGGYNQPSTDRYNYSGGGNINLRVGQKFQINYGSYFNNQINDRGYVDKTYNNETIYFAKRDVNTFQNVINTSYGINNKASLQFRLRHYWSGAKNKIYYQLQEDGTLEEDPTYSKNKDSNYNAFNIDMIFRWIFAPGSEISIAWKNSIYNFNNNFNSNYFKNLKNTWDSDQTNSLSVKILYYIDYNNLRKKN